MAVKFDKRKLVRDLGEQGLRLVNSKNHLKFQGNDGQIICLPATPGCWRTMKNMERTLKRYGYTLNPAKRGGRATAQ